ncbi:MAG: hypothetical protein RI897_2612 [Verrucomicrobiota bacterium]|jgi:hypothetical protein
MNRVAITTHRKRLYVLFAIFEPMVLLAVVVLWCVDPRSMSGLLHDTAGTVYWLSLGGLLVVSRLLQREAARLARVGLITAVGGFIACSLLPAIP